MLAIERMYRHELLIERLEQIQSEMAVVAASLYRIEDEHEHEYLNRAEALLSRAVKALHDARAEVRSKIQPELIEAQFKASIELVHRSPERMRKQTERQS